MAMRKKSLKKTDPHLAKVYEEIRRDFTAADLQKFTEDVPTMPFLQMVEEIEALHARTVRKQVKQSKKK